MYMMQFLLKIFRSVLNLLSAELPYSRGIFVRLESRTGCDWKVMAEFVLDLASCTTGRVYTVQVIHLMRGTHLYKDWTLDTTYFYCPPVTLKWKSDDLFFAWSRNLHDDARGPRLGTHSAWQPADERVTAVSKDWTHHTFIAPFWCAVPRSCHEW